MSIKRAFFWLHLAVGLACGLFIALLALTGASIAYGPQLIESAQRDVTRVPVATTPRLPVAELVKKAGEQFPGLSPAGIFVYADPERAVMIAGGRGKPSYYANPYTGEVKEQGAAKTRQFITFMTGLHRWLALTDKSRQTGMLITGSASVGFAIVCITGLVIWWPRQFKRRTLRPSVWFMKGAKGKVRDWNWHNVFGIWSLPLITVLAVTGAMIAFPWARGLLYIAVGEKPPVRGEGPPGAGREGGAPREGEAARRTETERAPAGEGARAERPRREEGAAETGERRERSGETGERREGTERREGGAPQQARITPPSPDTKPITHERAIEIVTKDSPEWEYVSFRSAAGNSPGGNMRQRRPEGGEAASGETRPRRAEGAEGAAPAPETGERRRRENPEGAVAAAGERAPRGENAGESGEERPRRRRQGGGQGGGMRGGAAAGTAPLAVSVKRSDTAPLFAQVSYTLNPYTGEVMKKETFSDKSLGNKLGGSVRNVHTGEGFGWFGQTLMFLACLATVVLAYTGFALSWRRFFPRKHKRHHQHRGEHEIEPAPAA